MNFAMVWTKLLDSPLWINQPCSTRVVWITMLLMKDNEGMVHCSLAGLANRAVVTPKEAKEAILFLERPDPDSTCPDEQGRRIVPFQGGWKIVNHDLYRFAKESARLYWSVQKQEARDRKKKKEPGVSATYRGREQRFIEAEKKGDTKEADAVAAEGLPKAAPEPDEPDVLPAPLEPWEDREPKF